MSLFDQPESKNLAEVFPPGVPFRLVHAFISGQVTSPGTGAVRTLAKVIVSPVEHSEMEREYGVWGSLCDQVRAIEPGELPAIVTLDNSTGLWRFAPHGRAPVSENGAEQPMAAVPEAHLDLDNAETDAPTPVPPPAQPMGTDIDESHSEAPAQLPPPAQPRGTELDESQVFQPGDPSPGEGV